MKNTVKKLIALTLAAILLLSFAACGGTNNIADETTPVETSKDADSTTPAEEAKPDSTLNMKIYALNGTTALGMAKMIYDANNDTDTMDYEISLHTAADAITGAIIQGECAIAALPTNVAVKLFNKSNGKLQLLALNTLGVLYLLNSSDADIDSLDDLKGKTVYLPGAGSNPEFITAALLDASGLKLGEDVTLDTTSYPSPDALQQALIAGLVDIAVLPEPKVTVTTTKASNVKIAIDLTEEWEKINGENTLVQGCLVVNTAFAEAHPLEVKQFLEDYQKSVEFVTTFSEEAINVIVDDGVKILPSAPIAQKALPNCNICFIYGSEMKPLMNSFCEEIFAYNQESIGALPTDAFYYIP